LVTPAAGAVERVRWLAPAVLSLAVILSMTTWFSASAVIPQLRIDWSLSPNGTAALAVAVQPGFVAGAVVSSIFNVPDLFPARMPCFA
jgi:hypothetical protein